MDGSLSIDEENGLCNARTRLDDLLQDLIEKTVEVKSEPIDEEEEKDHFSSDLDISDHTNVLSPKKNSPIKSRKRKRKDDSPQKDTFTHNTYVMKMFDRSVDLARFDSSTPLYPICRAWISNDPQNQPQAKIEAPRTPSPEPEPTSQTNNQNSGAIHELPAPKPLDVVNGAVVDLRIPEPLSPQKDDVSLDAYINDEVSAPPREIMLLDHMNRWKEVRSRWKIAAQLNEARFNQSAAILKSIFDQ